MVKSYAEIKKYGTQKYCLEELEKHLGDRHDPDVLQAFYFAAGAHSEQMRKSDEIAYIIHPVHVACIVAKYVTWCDHSKEFPEEMMLGALLHDTVEDTTVTQDLIELIFGRTTDRIVFGMTKADKPQGMNRKGFKNMELERLRLETPAVQTVKVADIVSNTASMREVKPEFYHDVYFDEQYELFKVLTKAHPALIERGQRMFDELIELDRNDNPDPFPTELPV